MHKWAVIALVFQRKVITAARKMESKHILQLNFTYQMLQQSSTLQFLSTNQLLRAQFGFFFSSYVHYITDF